MTNFNPATPNLPDSNVIDFASFAGTPALPPHNIEAEEAILGGILLDPEAIGRISDRLVPEAFYISAHAAIYRAALNLHNLGKPTDLLSLTAWLVDNKFLDKVGGKSKLASLVAVSAINIDALADLVMDKYTRRRLISAASQIERLAHDGTKSLEQVTDEVEQTVYRIAQSGKTADLNQVETLADVGPRLWEQLEQGKTTGVKTNGTFLDLDAMLGGFRPGNLIIAAGRTSMGKALPLDARIVTPSGWKLMRDIKVGDLVAGSDGCFYPVTGVFPQGVKQTYRVELNDGTVARCCADHLWFTKTHADRKAGKPGAVKSLREIMQTLWVEHRVPRLNHQIPMTEPVAFPEKDLPIHPYLLGIWLGDGSKGKRVEIANPEEDIQSQIRALIPVQDNISVFLSEDRTDRVFVNGGTTKSALEGLGLLGLYSYEKYIPEVYKTASIEQRFSLLAGLLDTDGHVAVSAATDNLGNCVEYATTSEQLRNDILELVRSLGGRATFIQRMGVYRLDGERIETRVNYRVYVSFPKGVRPVRSQKHLARFVHRNRPLTRAIQAIIPDAEIECQCISVDSPNHLFLTDDFIPTHNTQLAIALAYEVAKQGLPVAFFTCEMSKEEIANRLLARIALIDSDRLRNGRIAKDEWGHLANALDVLMALPIHIQSAARPRITEMRSVLRRVTGQHKGKKMGLVILDYIQLLGDSADNRVTELDKIVRDFYALAKEFDVPALGLAQINRGVENRADKRPLLSDIRESGAIENHADVVAFLYRDEYYNKAASTDKGIIEIDIAKNRHGKTGTVRMLFAPEYSLFRNLAKGKES